MEVIFEMLLVAQLFKKFPFSMKPKDYYSSQDAATGHFLNQINLLYVFKPHFWHILILFFYLCHCLQNDSFPSGFSTEILFVLCYTVINNNFEYYSRFFNQVLNADLSHLNLHL